jgi:CBS domain-containing protein
MSAIEESNSTVAELAPPQAQTDRRLSAWADKYRGVCQHRSACLHRELFILTTNAQATVEDLDPPPALSLSPTDSISHALSLAFERDYTHLTILSSSRHLLGYLSIPRLKNLLKERTVSETDTVDKAMLKFKRGKAHVYRVITMDTPLEELEGFFDGKITGGKEEFAVVTDGGRRFVLGVATKADLEEFVRRRPS